jgi:hypothetical protein
MTPETERYRMGEVATHLLIQVQGERAAHDRCPKWQVTDDDRWAYMQNLGDVDLLPDALCSRPCPVAHGLTPVPTCRPSRGPGQP